MDFIRGWLAALFKSSDIVSDLGQLVLRILYIEFDCSNVSVEE